MVLLAVEAYEPSPQPTATPTLHWPIGRCTSSYILHISPFPTFVQFPRVYPYSWAQLFFYSVFLPPLSSPAFYLSIINIIPNTPNVTPSICLTLKVSLSTKLPNTTAPTTIPTLTTGAPKA